MIERRLEMFVGTLKSANAYLWGACEDRNGRHWLRVELISTFLKFRTALTWQLWKRRKIAWGVRPPDHLTVAFVSKSLYCPRGRGVHYVQTHQS